MTRHSILLSLALFACAAQAQQLSLVGVIGDKAAVLTFDGGEPRAVRVGQRLRDVRVISVASDHATVEVAGAQRVLRLEQHYGRAPGADGRQSAVLSADPQGHFAGDGAVNGVRTRFVVDTGATMVALPGRDAKRIGIDYYKGQITRISTAGGPALAYVIKLDTVRVGEIVLTNVDAMIVETGLEMALLGMSFLNRVEYKREGQLMTLTRRF